MKIRFNAIASISIIISSTAYSSEKMLLIDILKSEIGIKNENIIETQSKNEIYISQIEECGLITCYRHNLAVAKKENTKTYFVSVLRTGEVIPFKDKTKISNGNKDTSKKIKKKISDAILKFDSSATVILDDENADTDVDCSTQFSDNVAYGASIEPVMKDVGTPKITYFEKDYLIKNGFWGLPIDDTIPNGGIIVIQDFFCGLNSKDDRKMNFFAIAPEFKNFRDIDTNEIYRPKIRMMNIPGKFNCPETHNYFIYINKSLDAPFRFVVTGKVSNSSKDYVFDWRITKTYSIFNKK